MSIVRAEALRNKESGPVALLGNGPSLKRWPLDRLNCPTIGINKSWERTKSKYHCFVSGYFVEQFNTGIVESEVVFFSFRFIQRLAKNFVSQYKGLLVPVMEMPKQRKLQWNLSQGSDATFGGIFAIQVALFLGFKKLYLLGYDEHNDEGHFSEDKTQVENREGTHLPFYSLAKHTTDSLGIKVFVCNRESAIRIWPFADPPLTNML